jgi:hypothetical protein
MPWLGPFHLAEPFFEFRIEFGGCVVACVAFAFSTLLRRCTARSCIIESRAMLIRSAQPNRFPIAAAIVEGLDEFKSDGAAAGYPIIVSTLPGPVADQTAQRAPVCRTAATDFATCSGKTGGRYRKKSRTTRRSLRAIAKVRQAMPEAR